ncbi:MAG TPA: hypothetical protein VIE44_11555 [Methylomirabilota bacterium]
MELTREAVLVDPGAQREAPRLGRRIRRALRSSVVLGGPVVSGLIVAVALLAGVIAPVAPDEQNYPVTQSTILFVAALFMALNLAVDLLYGYLEPRIRYGD